MMTRDEVSSSCSCSPLEWESWPGRGSIHFFPGLTRSLPPSIT